MDCTGFKDLFKQDSSNRSEQRIRRRVRASVARQNNRDPEEELEETINHYQDQAYKLGERIYNNAQSRKGIGKQLFISWTKQGVGQAARTMLGPRKSSSSTSKKPTLRIANPKIKLRRK